MPVSSDMVPAGGRNPLALLQAAIEKGMDPDKLGKLMDLAERWEANQAAAAFGVALASFQSQCPVIKKKRKADVGGKFSFQYAGFDDIDRVVRPILAECGLSVTFKAQDDAGNGNGNARRLKVTCQVRHGSHTEETTVNIPIPAMSVNDTQQYGAAVSYAKRFSLCAALNIVVSDEDDDAAKLVQVVTEEQAAEIEALIAEKSVDLGKFLDWCQVASITDIPAANYPKVVHTLRVKRKVGGK